MFSNIDLSTHNIPRFILTKEFMVNKESNAVLISSLLTTQLQTVKKTLEVNVLPAHNIIIYHCSLKAVK